MFLLPPKLILQYYHDDLPDSHVSPSRRTVPFSELLEVPPTTADVVNVAAPTAAHSFVVSWYDVLITPFFETIQELLALNYDLDPDATLAHELWAALMHSDLNARPRLTFRPMGDPTRVLTRQEFLSMILRSREGNVNLIINVAISDSPSSKVASKINGPSRPLGFRRFSAPPAKGIGLSVHVASSLATLDVTRTGSVPRVATTVTSDTVNGAPCMTSSPLRRTVPSLAVLAPSSGGAEDKRERTAATQRQDGMATGTAIERHRASLISYRNGFADPVDSAWPEFNRWQVKQACLARERNQAEQVHSTSDQRTSGQVYTTRESSTSDHREASRYSDHKKSTASLGAPPRADCAHSTPHCSARSTATVNFPHVDPLLTDNDVHISHVNFVHEIVHMTLDAAVANARPPDHAPRFFDATSEHGKAAYKETAATAHLRLTEAALRRIHALNVVAGEDIMTNCEYHDACVRNVKFPAEDVMTSCQYRVDTTVRTVESVDTDSWAFLMSTFFHDADGDSTIKDHDAYRDPFLRSSIQAGQQECYTSALSLCMHWQNVTKVCGKLKACQVRIGGLKRSVRWLRRTIKIYLSCVNGPLMGA